MITYNDSLSRSKNIFWKIYPLTPLCVACKYKRIFGVLEVLKIRKIDTDILACNYVRIYLHAILNLLLKLFSD